ncbi:MULTISPECIES: hypothetical protein [Burkholderiaceae]|uniref:hypothetical protein n=1 Tax=Burkholderiaceae TaxID=119060 RepID=UPI001608FD59|nr:MULTISPECIES: hypothetical protein [Burkholderiaceae]MBB2981600.1 hypothetical protein [Paraburkholderia tropica]
MEAIIVWVQLPLAVVNGRRVMSDAEFSFAWGASACTSWFTGLSDFTRNRLASLNSFLAVVRRTAAGGLTTPTATLSHIALQLVAASQRSSNLYSWRSDRLFNPENLHGLAV